MRHELKGELTIAKAASIKAELLRAVSANGPFELDTSGVSEVDAAGLQLLLSAMKSAARRNATIVFPAHARGDAVSDALELLGLGSRDWSGEDFGHG